MLRTICNRKVIKAFVAFAQPERYIINTIEAIHASQYEHTNSGLVRNSVTDQQRGGTLTISVQCHHLYLIYSHLFRFNLVFDIARRIL